MRIILAGGTGFIGQELVRVLNQNGHQVILLTRKFSPQSKNPLLTHAQWDGKTLSSWAQFFEGADAVINLCGEPVAGKRWNERQKNLILSGRLEATHAICEAISKAVKKPEVLINASGAGYYGNRPDEMLSESAPSGKGFLAQTCVTWELAAKRAESLGVRVVMLRIGMVLANDGGALEKLLPPFYFYAGGPLGSGKQGLPWIHRDDVAGIILHLLLHREISGPVNTVAPEMVTNEQFSKVLGKILHRPARLKTPAWTLKLILGEMAEELLLSGQKTVPAKLLRAGYQFKYPELEPALRAILAK